MEGARCGSTHQSSKEVFDPMLFTDAQVDLSLFTGRTHNLIRNAVPRFTIIILLAFLLCILHSKYSIWFLADSMAVG